MSPLTQSPYLKIIQYSGIHGGLFQEGGELLLAVTTTRTPASSFKDESTTLPIGLDGPTLGRQIINQAGEGFREQVDSLWKVRLLSIPSGCTSCKEYKITGPTDAKGVTD